jgi:hypothetical protein
VGWVVGGICRLLKRDGVYAKESNKLEGKLERKHDIVRTLLRVHSRIHSMRIMVRIMAGMVRRMPTRRTARSRARGQCRSGTCFGGRSEERHGGQRRGSGISVMVTCDFSFLFLSTLRFVALSSQVLVQLRPPR